MPWNRPTEDHRPTTKKKSSFAMIIWVLIAVMGIGFALWLVFSKSEEKPTFGDGSRGMIASKGVSKRPPTRGKPKKAKSAKECSNQMDNRQNALDILTNHPPIAIRRVSTNAFVMGRGPKAFRNGVEQLIVRVFCCPLGSMPEPLPNLPEMDERKMLKMLTDQNPINEDDSDMIAGQKEVIEEARLEMAKYVANGGNPDEFLGYYHKQLLQAHSYRQMAMNEVSRIKEEEHDPSLAKAMMEKINEKLKADGILQMTESEFGGFEEEEDMEK